MPAEIPAGVTFLPYDLAATAGRPDLVAEVERVTGPLDVLVNNAGIWRETPSLGLNHADWHEVIAVNLTAPVLLASRVATGMAERGYGRIVNITSIHGRFAAKSALAYATAKGGLEQATRNLAVDLAPHGILVNAVAPGPTKSRPEQGDAPGPSILARMPLQRFGTPEEIAAVVAFLASDEASFTTGHVYAADGGFTITGIMEG
jgi:NAD(P)-dependent dehydrogenase (short-subunit alcohol dehydrogenase family)